MTGVRHSERIDTIYNVKLFQSISYNLKMSGPVSAPNSVVYECESPPRYKKRRLSPIEESPQLFRRITRSEEIQSPQNCLQIERRGVGKFFLSQIRR